MAESSIKTQDIIIYQRRPLHDVNLTHLVLCRMHLFFIFYVYICFTSVLCCEQTDSRHDELWPRDAHLSEVLSPNRSEVHGCHYRRSSGEPCQFLSQIALAVSLEIDSCFLAALRTFPIRTFEDKILRIEPVWFIGLCPLHMSHLLYKCTCTEIHISHHTYKISVMTKKPYIVKFWLIKMQLLHLYVQFSIYNSCTVQSEHN